MSDTATETKKRDTRYAEMIEKDLETVIDTVVDHAMGKLKAKFPKEREYDLIARDFTTSLNIENASKDPSVLLPDTSASLLGLVIEHYVGDAVSAVTAFSHLGKKAFDPEKYNTLLEKLRDVSLIQDLDRHTGFDNFTDWVNKKDHDPFFMELEKKHSDLFSIFGYDATVTLLIPILQSMIERAYRSDGIQEGYIDKEIGIKDQVKAVFRWYKEKSGWWWKEEVQSWFPEFRPQKHRRVTCVEIVPRSFMESHVLIGNKDRKNRRYDPGKLGGKVLKISDDYDDMRQEFSVSQVNTFASQIEAVNMTGEVSREKMDSLRLQSFLGHFNRYYIAPEMIEKYIDLMEKVNNISLGSIREDRMLRNFFYKSIFATATTNGDLPYLFSRTLTGKPLS
jgi:hypothetical protein